MTRFMKIGCLLVLILAAGLAASALLNPPPAGFEFQIPAGWTTIKDAKKQLLKLDLLTPQMKEAISRTNYVVYAVDVRAPDPLIRATFNAVTSDALSVELTEIIWNQILGGIAQMATRAGVSFKVVKYTLEDFGGVPVGSAITELQGPGGLQRQLSFYIPGRAKDALLTYSTEPSRFDPYVPVFEASARATRGAGRPTLADQLLRIPERITPDQAGRLVGQLVGAIGGFAVFMSIVSKRRRPARPPSEGGASDGPAAEAKKDASRDP
jgi:hypothetical protein